LLEGTPVGASLIDAHAGGVGTVGGRAKSAEPVDVRRRLAYIMGTSACIMATTSEPRFVPGVWGPYYSGMVPGFWLNEGGQSAAGAAIDHLVKSHPAYHEAVATARAGGMEILEFLETRIVARLKTPGEAALLAHDIHVLPEFLGNRPSPIPTPAQWSQGWISTSTSTRWSGCSWPGCAGSPTVLPMSSKRFDRTAWTAI
jgi:D-ribulokinase